MRQLINLEDWKRKEHYFLFKDFAEPFYGVCVEIDCTDAYRKVKETNTSFFLYYLHKSTVAANYVENFRYRIVDEKVYLYDIVEPETTIARNDGTFGFCYLCYNEDFNKFEAAAKHEIDRVKNSSVLELPANINAIHYSAIPWINFTSLSHARQFSSRGSCPKISFGKVTENHLGRLVMPVSIHVHHSLVDGIHISEYIDKFQQLMNE